jgi:hypothetical protein
MLKKPILSMFFLAAALGAVFAQAEKTGSGAFEWSVGILNQKRKSVIALNRPVAMEEGDRFSFRLKSGADCFAYVVAQFSDSSAAALYAGPLKAGGAVDVGPLDVPPSPGTETFYIIISAAEQAVLTEAIEAYKTGPDPARAVRSVANEIFNIRRAVSRLNENTEKQVSMGDGVEGLEFSGAGTYVKTVMVDH